MQIDSFKLNWQNFQMITTHRAPLSVKVVSSFDVIIGSLGSVLAVSGLCLPVDP